MAGVLWLKPAVSMQMRRSGKRFYSSSIYISHKSFESRTLRNVARNRVLMNKNDCYQKRTLVQSATVGDCLV